MSAGMAAPARGALSEGRYNALQRAAHLNPDVELLPGNKAVQHQPDGSVRRIANSTPYTHLFWGCEGCRGGLQHYRLCTSHALGKALALRCLYCSYDEGEWVAAGRQLPWESELKLMRELVGAQLSEEWCCQAAPGFWPAAVDFMHTSQKAIMQADGSGHFHDTFDVSCRSVLEQDMSCCVKAVEAGVSVIRVHDQQLQRGLRHGFLAAACQVATSCLCVVLSPAYHTVCIYEAGRMVTYADMLASRLPAGHVMRVPWGIVILCKK